VNLSFFVNVAIGLFFIYLILGLLISEIQELITTLLQWRARHLRDAIEVLLAGGTAEPEVARAKTLVKKLYDDTLMKTMNQSAKSGVAAGIRKLTRWLNPKGSFGSHQTTGPSYIAPDTFATSLIDSLGLPSQLRKLTEFRLKKFVTHIIGDYVTNPDGTIEIFANNALQEDMEKGKLRSLAEQYDLYTLHTDLAFHRLVETYDDILQSFKGLQDDLPITVRRFSEALNTFIQTCESQQDPGFIAQLKNYHRSLFGESGERALMVNRLRPSLSELAQLVDAGSNVCQEVKCYYERFRVAFSPLSPLVDSAIQAQLAAYNQNRPAPLTLAQLPDQLGKLIIDQALQQLIDQGQITTADAQAYRDFQAYQSMATLLDNLPRPLRNNLTTLARRAEVRSAQVGNELNQFREEISLWFDRSMVRASGVYKRNAKGVAIILGLMLAIATNTDSFFIVDRLSNNENLRNVVTQRAVQLIPPNSGESPRQQLENLRNQTNDVLEELSVPIGWNAVNLTQQFGCPLSNTTIPTSNFDWNGFSQACLNQPTTDQDFLPSKVAAVGLKNPIPALRVLFGWVLTGVALSMGAPFWFDLLNRIMNVRNTGTKPASPESQKPHS